MAAEGLLTMAKLTWSKPVFDSQVQRATHGKCVFDVRRRNALDDSDSSFVWAPMKQESPDDTRLFKFSGGGQVPSAAEARKAAAAWLKKHGLYCL